MDYIDELEILLGKLNARGITPPKVAQRHYETYMRGAGSSRHILNENDPFIVAEIKFLQEYLEEIIDSDKASTLVLKSLKSLNYIPFNTGMGMEQFLIPQQMWSAMLGNSRIAKYQIPDMVVRIDKGALSDLLALVKSLRPRTAVTKKLKTELLSILKFNFTLVGLEIREVENEDFDGDLDTPVFVKRSKSGKNVRSLITEVINNG